MSRGKQLQEMDHASTPGQGGGAGSGATQSKTAVNSGASAPDSMSKSFRINTRTNWIIRRPWWSYSRKL
jgi:hypothetical protein